MYEYFFQRFVTFKREKYVKEKKTFTLIVSKVLIDCMDNLQN